MNTKTDEGLYEKARKLFISKASIDEFAGWATPRQVDAVHRLLDTELANRFRAEYAKGTKKQKGEVLDRLVAVGMGRSTARRLLSQAVGSEERPGPGRGRRPKYGEETQRLLERLWLLMGMPCGRT